MRYIFEGSDGQKPYGGVWIQTVTRRQAKDIGPSGKHWWWSVGYNHRTCRYEVWVHNSPGYQNPLPQNWVVI